MRSKSILSTALAAVTALAGVASATFPGLHRGNGMEIGPVDDAMERLSKRAEGFSGWATFDQLIDHDRPRLGTFKQRYWYGTEFWTGPGSPVFVTNPGEQSAEGFNRTYFTDLRLPGRMAREMGGAVIILEHRYWGESSPYQVLTAKNLTHLTLDNALRDNTYFANKVRLPFDPSGGSHPKRAPWVFVGGSYSGAMAAWIEHLEPGTFWAYYSSSGVVQAITDFWQ